MNDCILTRLPWDPSYPLRSNTTAEHFVNPEGASSKFDYQITGNWKPQERVAYNAMLDQYQRNSDGSINVDFSEFGIDAIREKTKLMFENYNNLAKNQIE